MYFNFSFLLPLLHRRHRADGFVVGDNLFIIVIAPIR